MIVAVSVIAALTVINTVLLLAVIRRIGEHEHRFTQLSGGDPAIDLKVGDEVGDFELPSLDGAAFDSALHEGPLLIGIFSPTCSVCAEALPEFVEDPAVRARARPVAIIAAEESDGARYVEGVLGQPQISILIAPDTPENRSLMLDKLKVRGFPLFVELDESRRVRSVGADLGSLLQRRVT